MDSTTSGIPTSILAGTKFKIQQSVPSGSVKRGPHAIVRTADLNDGIAIKRRFGEGSKPLFADIPIKQTPVDGQDSSVCHDQSFNCKSKSNRRSSSTDTSSPERYRHREKKKHSSPVSSRRKSLGRSTCNDRDKDAHHSKFDSTKTDNHRRRERNKSRSRSPVKNKPAPKLPYYRDERREKDRLRRLYGYSRSRSSSPRSGRKISPIAKRRIESPLRRRRSISGERRRRNSPYRSSRRDYRSRRSRTPSKHRSPKRRERHKDLNRNSDKEHKEGSNSSQAPVIPATQYIPIPVPVPADYTAYSFPGWTPPQPPWHNNPHRPPPASHFVPFPIWPMIPPIRPPHQASFAGMPPSSAYTHMTPHYRPTSQRYPPPRYNSSNYQSRPKKPSN